MLQQRNPPIFPKGPAITPSSLVVLEPCVGCVILDQAIFSPDLICLSLPLCSLLCVFLLHLSLLPLHLGVFLGVLGAIVLLAAAATADTDSETEDEQSTNHSTGDDQGLVVHPAHGPFSISQGTFRRGNQVRLQHT